MPDDFDEPSDSISGTAPPGQRLRNRRRRSYRVLLIVAATCGVAATVFLLSHSSRNDDEIARLEAVFGEMRSHVSPDSAHLLDEAKSVSTRMLRQFPDNVDVLATIAGLYNSLGRAEEAVRCWQECIELDPASAPMCHAAIAAIARERGEHDEAAHHFRMAMEQDPQSTAYPVELAEILINQGKPQEAVDLLERHRESHPRSMPTFVLLGQAYVQLREFEKARRYLELGVEMGPDYTNAYYGLATACARLGDGEKSKEYLAKFKELQAREEQTHRDALKTTAGTAEFRHVLINLHTASGRAYIAREDLRMAEWHLLRAAELSPTAADCRMTLAWLYEAQGRLDETLITLTQLGENAPNELGVQLNIAETFTRLQRFSLAQTAYRRAIALTPHQAHGYALLAERYLEWQRKHDEAKTLAQKAVDLEPTARHYFLLSRACLATEDLTGARNAIEQAMALDKNNAQYRDLQATIRKR